MNKTQLAETRYKDKKNNNHLQKKKKAAKIQKIKQYELIKKRSLIRKQNELGKELKQYERFDKKQNVVEDIDLGSFFNLATTNKIYVSGLNLHQTKS